MSADAEVMGCTRCGAALPVDFRVPALVCERCGHAHEVDEALRARMRAYVGELGRAALAELDARWNAVFFDNHRQATAPFMAGAVGSAILTAVWILMLAAERTSLPTLLGVTVGTMGCVAALGWGFRRMYRIPTLAALEHVTCVRCGGCGAYSAFGAHRSVSSCEYCGSDRLVPTRVMVAVLGQAHAELAQAARDEHHAGRSAVARADRAGVAAVIAIVLAVLVGMPALLALEQLVLADAPKHSVWLGLWPVLAQGGIEVVFNTRQLLAVGRAKLGTRAEIEARG